MNAVVSLAHETAVMGYGSLIFAGSRSICEADARLISKVMPQPDELDSATMDKRMDLLSELRSLSTGADPVLEETVLYGVAFHRKSFFLDDIPLDSNLILTTIFIKDVCIPFRSPPRKHTLANVIGRLNERGARSHCRGV